MSFGPTVDGKQLVRVDGSFVYQAATATAAGFVDVAGTLTLASFKIANAYFNYYTTGEVQFGGHLQLGLPDATASKPQQQPVYIDASLNGAISGSKFDVDVNATVALNFIDLTLGAEVLVSDKGIVGCARVSAFGFTWSPGVGYTWATHSLDLMASGCSVGPWKTLAFGQAIDATAVRRLRLAPGRALIELRGSTGAPKVKLTGPAGQHVTVPAGSVKPFMARGVMVFQDPTDKRTWIAIQHAGGAWRIAPEHGSSPITSIRVAGLLPDPRITGKLSGSGNRRTLAWRLRRIAGQRVVFWERGKGVARIIGSTSAARGKLRFRLPDGDVGRRTIEAQVIELGRPRTDVTIARFTAAVRATPGKPTHVTVTALSGGALLVSWRPAPLAQHYLVEVDTKDGGRLVEFAGASARGIQIHNVVPITSATVHVTAERDNGVRGPTVTVHFPPAAGG